MPFTPPPLAYLGGGHFAECVGNLVPLLQNDCLRQFLGFSILAIGVWAWSEKNTFNNLSQLTHIPMDPAFAFIIVGAITFIIGFTGCVGALRENTCLLAFVSSCWTLCCIPKVMCNVI